jgi:esterase/lipase superfamily enzyme
MQVASCRDPKNDTKPYGTPGMGSIQWGFLPDNGTFAPLNLFKGEARFQQKVTLANESSHAIILVHGFNTNQQRLRDAYHSIRNILGDNWALGPNAIYGFSWPSQSGASPFHYWTAFNHSIASGEALRQMILDLKQYGYKRVSIVCHSMGSILVMNMLKSIESGLVHRVVIHGGDAAWGAFKTKNHFGSQCAAKINRLYSYYSRGDEILRFVAKLVRPVERIGEREMPMHSPDSYKSIDAQGLTTDHADVNHSTYMSSIPILRDTALRLEA